VSVRVPEVPDRCDVGVLGAGPAGLAAAWYASRRGFTVTVIDRADRVGGLAGSIIVDEQSVDLGSHRLHASVRADLLADVRDVLHVDLQWRPRNGRIRLRGRWVAFPLRPFDLLRNAPPSFVTRVLGDIVASPLRQLIGSRARDTESFSQQVRLRLGPTIAGAFYEPYAHKLWGVAGDHLSAELFQRRVSAGSAVAIARRLVRKDDPPGFWYPTAGFGEICAALANDVGTRGGAVLTDTHIESIDEGPDGVGIHLRDGRSIAARTVVSTIPSSSLLRLVRAPSPVVDASDVLTFRGALLVYLTVPRPQYSPFDAHYFPEPSTILSRLSEPKNYRTSAADPPLRTVLCAEVPASVGDALWQADDETLARRVRAELVRLGLPDPNPVTAHVERRAHVYPIYRLGFEHQRRLIDDHIDRWHDIAVVGRQALFAHDNTHHALLMGKAVVDALGDDARLDRGRWNAVRQTFADHVVED
jgi:protoporphyrinogen oxidase